MTVSFTLMGDDESINALSADGDDNVILLGPLVIVDNVVSVIIICFWDNKNFWKEILRVHREQVPTNRFKESCLLDSSLFPTQNDLSNVSINLSLAETGRQIASHMKVGSFLKLLGSECKTRADSRFAPSQWETALLCNDVSRCLSANLESALWDVIKTSFRYISDLMIAACVCLELCEISVNICYNRPVPGSETGHFQLWFCVSLLWCMMY